MADKVRMLIKVDGVLVPADVFEREPEPVQKRESATRVALLILKECAYIAILAVAVAVKKRWQHAKGRN